MKRSAPIRQISVKRAELNKQRREIAKVIALRSGGRCEAASLIAAVDPVAASNCTVTAVDLHEKLKRSRGGSIIDPDNITACCRSCHEWTEREPRLATAVGLLTPTWGPKR